MRTLSKLAVVLLATILAGCAAPERVVMAGLGLSNPAIAGRTGPLTMLQPVESDRPAAKNKADRAAGARKPAESKEKAAESKNRSDDPGFDDSRSAVKATRTAAMLMVPASGDIRARLVRSAKRLVGIRKSFDTRSFIGHVLAICDLLPPKARSTMWTSVDVLERARAASSLREGREGAKSGDLVFFKCGRDCGADAADGIGVGVCVDDSPGNESFVAYIEGTVGLFGKERFSQLTGSSAP